MLRVVRPTKAEELETLRRQVAEQAADIKDVNEYNALMADAKKAEEEILNRGVIE